MNTEAGVLKFIHQWDVVAFRMIMASRLRREIGSKARLVSKTGDGWLYPFVPVVIWLAGSPLAQTFFLYALIAYGVERLIYVVAKNGFKRKRPQNVLPDYESLITASDEFSFPSGHTSAAFLMVTLLVLFFGWVFTPLYLWAACVAFSRILLGVHFPSDILVGAAMGSIIGLVVVGSLL